MPELPEVETTRRGIAPYCEGQLLTKVLIRQPRLRWPVPQQLPTLLQGQSVRSVDRRAKYLLLHFDNGTLLVHLGMSGSLRLVTAAQPVGKHDHIDLVFDNGRVLRFNDPRRFGSFLWQSKGQTHTLLDHLGPEPLSQEFDGRLLYRRSRGRRGAVKHFIMDAQIVAGVGNIYANEALFAAGIRPDRAAGRISQARYARLATEIKIVLEQAILQGGTTLRDFVGSDGKPGYFSQQLNVYGRAGKPCVQCGRPLIEKRLNQRSTVFCLACQR